jgi:hypothetical protein
MDGPQETAFSVPEADADRGTDGRPIVARYDQIGVAISVHVSGDDRKSALAMRDVHSRP